MLFRQGLKNDEIFKEMKMPFRNAIVVTKLSTLPQLILFSLNKGSIWKPSPISFWKLKEIIVKLNYKKNNYNCQDLDTK